MLFAWTANLVAEGKKSQTRRLVRPGDSLGFTRAEGGVVTPAVVNASQVYVGSQKKPVMSMRLRWVVGRTYGVQPGFRKPSICWIQVTGLRFEPDPMAISDDDARAEGYQDAADFVKHWKKNHRVKEADPAYAVWVISFKLVRKEQR